MDVSVVIPTYNSELIIDKLVNKISLDTVSSYEIIVVNDKSKDNTFQKLKRIKNETPNLKIINLKENIGQVGATLVGVQNAKGEIIVTMDDDLQHNPKYFVPAQPNLANPPMKAPAPSVLDYLGHCQF